jgi:hypothetical protein
MHQRSSEIIRAVLSSKVRDLLVETNRPANAAPLTPPMQSNLIADLEAYSLALVDFMRAGQATADDVALNALDTLVDGAVQLAELDKYFDKGTGKGSPVHQFIRRLRTLAESQLPLIQEAAQ